MKSAGKARNNGLYRHIRTSKEIIRNLLNDSTNSSYVLLFVNFFILLKMGMKKPRCACIVVKRSINRNGERHLNRSPSTGIWRVCPFPHFFWPSGRVAAQSLLQMQSYPTLIIADSFLYVKNWILLHQFFKIFFTNPIKRHNRIFEIRVIRIQHQAQHHIQIGVRKSLYGKYSTHIFDILNQNVRG